MGRLYAKTIALFPSFVTGKQGEPDTHQEFSLPIAGERLDRYLFETRDRSRWNGNILEAIDTSDDPVVVGFVSS